MWVTIIMVLKIFPISHNWRVGILILTEVCFKMPTYPKMKFYGMVSQIRLEAIRLNKDTISQFFLVAVTKKTCYSQSIISEIQLAIFLFFL